MKKLLLVFTSIFLLLSFSGCCLSHEWEDATCSVPKTCSKCEKTEGDPLPHTWGKATCTTPKTCSVCGATEGTPIEHTWIDATCLTAKTCSVCGTVEGESTGHQWMEATCTNPKTCAVCSSTEGSVLEHNLIWTTTKEPAYFAEGEKEGICSSCGERVTEVIDALVPEYHWNESIQISPEITVGFYTDGSDYWFEMTGETFSSTKLIHAIYWGQGDIGFGRKAMYDWFYHIIDIADTSWKEGDVIYYVAEGYGRKWTVSFNTNDNTPGFICMKVNSEKELEAACDVDVLE